MAAELRTAVDKAERDLSFTEIRAPVDGVVGNKAVEVGTYVQPGTRLAALVPLDQRACRRQLQGDAARRPEARPEGAISGRCLPRRRHSTARSRASRRPPARCSACCRPRTPPATSPRSCSACPVRITVAPTCAQQGLLRPGLSVVVDVDTRTSADAPRLASLKSQRPWPQRLPSTQGPAPAGREAGAARTGAGSSPSLHGLRHVHGDPGHPDRLGLAGRDPGRPVAPSSDEISWVQTGYLIAEVIMIPLSGTLSRVLSTRVAVHDLGGRLHAA